VTDQITLTVNGEKHTVNAAHRTQLAEVLRDLLDLTGTHLGCEQGVCGACTVMLDGRPIRSCITYLNKCDGAIIETIEGHRDDPVMGQLRDAFSRHHALQCGFCTPGMLATGRDILARFPNPGEATIRHELSGNLCRCTGYVGIVAAIKDVAEHLPMSPPAPAKRPAKRPAKPPGRPLSTFAVATPAAANIAPTKRQGKVRIEGNWTVVEREFTLDHPVADVWNLFSDVARVAACVPGASISDLSGDSFNGAVEISFGPIRARFAGNGTAENHADTRRGHISGQGKDKGGQSNVRGELHYGMTADKADAQTTVSVDFKFQIQGMLAQFNRPQLVTGFVDFILEKFVDNCNAVLSGGSADATHKLSVFALGRAIVKSVWRSIYKRS
jgi:carbon-monoxide dehydrogenase small subunit